MTRVDSVSNLDLSVHRSQSRGRSGGSRRRHHGAASVAAAAAMRRNSAHSSMSSMGGASVADSHGASQLGFKSFITSSAPSEPWNCTLCGQRNAMGQRKCSVCARPWSFVPDAGPGACEHDFVNHRRLKLLDVATCSVCSNSIAGMGGRCLKCKKCKLKIHHKCLAAASQGRSARDSTVFAAFSQSIRSKRGLDVGMHRAAMRGVVKQKHIGTVAEEA